MYRGVGNVSEKKEGGETEVGINWILCFFFNFTN